MTQLTTSVLPPEITAKLHRLKSHLRNMTIVRGLGSTVLVSSVAILLTLLSDYFFNWNETLRTGFLLFSVSLVLFTIWNRIIRPARLSVTTEELAAIVEKQHPKLKERLSSTIELNDPNVPEEHKGSAVMREWLGKETYQATATIEFEDSIPSSRPKKTALMAMCMVFVLFMPFLFSPDGYGQMWSRFLTPWGDFDSNGNLYFEIENGNRTVARGIDLTISAKPKFRFHEDELPTNVWLERRMDDGSEDRRQLAYDEKLESFLVTVPHVMHAFDYRIVTDEIRTRGYRIDVMEPPSVLTALMEVQPPAYTGRAALQFDGMIGELNIFEHSEVRINVTFNKPVADIQLEWLNKDADQSDRAWTKKKEKLPKFAAVLAKDGKSASLSAKVYAGGWFVLRLTDEHGMQNLDPVERYLNIVRDFPPRLAILGTDITQKIRPDDTPVIRADSTDDIAVEALELHWEILGGEKGMITVPQNELGVSAKAFDFRLDIKKMKLSEGSSISFRVRAADGRPVPGPQEVWSTKRTLQIHKNAKAHGSQDVAKAQREKSHKLSEIRKALEKNKSEVEKLQKQTEKNIEEKTEFTKDRELNETAELQEKIAEQLNKLADEFGVSPIYANMTHKAREIAEQQLKPAANRLKQAAGEPLEAKKQSLQENADRLEKIIEELKNLESDHDELAGLERDLLELTRLAKKADDLADNAADIEKKQEDLDRQPPDKNKDDENKKAVEQQKLTEDQKKLLDEGNKLSKELFDLIKNNPELLEAAKQAQMEKLEDLLNNTKDLADQQKELAEALKDNAGDSAKKSAPQTEQQQKLVEQAEQLQKDIKKNDLPTQVHPIDTEKLREALEELKAGNLNSARDKQEKATQDLKKFAEDTKKLEGLSEEAKKAADQLAKAAEELAKKQQEAQKRTEEKIAEEKNAKENNAEQAAENQKNNNQNPSSKQGKSGEQTAKNQKAGGQKGNNKPGSKGESSSQQARKEQQEIAKEAAKLALDIAKEQGADSKVAKDARAFAEKANQASRQSQAGLMKPASKSAEEASQSAKKVADESRKENSSLAPEMKKQSQDLANRQEKTAEQFKKIAESPKQQEQALDQGQKRQADSAKNISEQVDKVAKNLTRKPLDEQKKSEEAQQIAKLVKKAQSEMQKAREQLKNSDRGKASESAKKAAKQLSEASKQASKSAKGNGKKESPVPSEVGEKVSEAARKLSEAAKKLSTQKSASGKNGKGKAGKGKGKSGKGKGKSGKGTGKSGKGKGNGQGKGKSGLSNDLKKAAEDLSQAVKQLFPEMPDSKPGNGSKTGKNGSGNQSEMDFGKLSQELKRLKKRDWGKLPGKLRTEILQASRKNPNGEYAHLIKLYFKEIADTRKLDREKK